MQKILIVEDDRMILDILSFNLEREGFAVEKAADGGRGLELALRGDCDLVLLDLMLPVMDGFEVCRRIREKSAVSVIMLTARESETDKVSGLDIGADDYITKPFSMRELISRVRSNLRRSGGSQALMQGQTELTFGPFRADLKQHRLYKNDIPVELTELEMKLVCCLAGKGGGVMSREELLKEVWGFTEFVDMRTVDVTVRRLREKLEDDPAAPAYIMTRRGAGYYFNMP